MVIFNYLDRIRREQGLLSIADIVELSNRGNVIFDPFSVLISRQVMIGSGNTFFSGVCLFCSPPGGLLDVGDENIFHANTVIDATVGRISIGSGNQFGEGGFTAKANRSGASIRIGDCGRYLNGASVFGQSDLGSGSQLLGAITVDSCVLEAGGSYRDNDANFRAGLLKGWGVARGLNVPKGGVIVGNGVFENAELQVQSTFHQKVTP